jgi:hypothetical protein
MVGRIIWITLGIILFILSSCGGQGEGSVRKMSTADKETLLWAAKHRILWSGFEDDFQKCRFAIVGIYRKLEIEEFDDWGIYHLKITIEPLVALKGRLDRKVIYLYVYSPAEQGFGYRENYGNTFLLFLKEDIFNNGRFVESYDFISAAKLPICIVSYDQGIELSGNSS